MTHYVIRGGAEGRKRLSVLGRTLWPTTSRLLEQVGLRAGMACLDLGCGGGDVAVEMAEWVGPHGSVAGIDMDAAKVDFAQNLAQEKGLTNASFRQTNVADWQEADAYDLVYCRFLLTHLRDPAAVLHKMWRAVRAGGRVVVEDIDFRGHFCHPACPAFDRYLELYRTVVARRGGDADIGPRLLSLARDAGWQDVDFQVVQPAFVSGEGKGLALLTLTNIADAVLAEGLATEAELQETIDELASFIDAGDTIVSLPRIFQVWASRR